MILKINKEQLRFLDYVLDDYAQLINDDDVSYKCEFNTFEDYEWIQEIRRIIINKIGE